MAIDQIWEKIHSKLNWNGLPDEQMARWLFNSYKGGLDQYKQMKVLDLGCGQGTSTVYLAGYGFNIVAVDGAPSALNKLKKRINGYPSVDLICCDMSRLGFHDGNFDVVIDMVSICCNDNYQEIFDEVARVLKIGGGFFSMLPASDTTKRFFDGCGKVNYFDRDQLRECLKNKFKTHIGYKLIEDESGNRLSHYMVEALRI